jgi:hypothetical protein
VFHRRRDAAPQTLVRFAHLRSRFFDSDLKKHPRRVSRSCPERRPRRLLLRRHHRRAGFSRARHPGHPLGPPAVHARAVPREAGLRV